MHTISRSDAKNYDNILALILGGGAGTRLYPLTQQRAKPAVPIAGKYRLIDIPISNSINSQIPFIAILTQFNSMSLNRHIARSYNFDDFSKGWVQIWAAEQTMGSNDWYQGTADAVRKQIHEIRSARCAYTLILSGDHLYRMDYRKLANSHWENDADVTIAVQPVSREDAPRLGILKCEPNGQIVDFSEKPKTPELLDAMVSLDDPEKPYLGSMGIYFFRTDLLLELLTENNDDDFGKHIIPYAIKNCKVFGYQFNDYWEDIGTIRSFYNTNLALARQDAPFNFFDPEAPIYTHSRFLPGSIIQNCTVEDAMISDGSVIQDSVIRNTVIGVRSQIGKGVHITNSIIMGADYYDSPFLRPTGAPPIGIGNGSQIEGAIIDKNARLGENVVIHSFPEGTELDTDMYSVRDGIVVIPKSTVIPASTRIAPAEAD
ncbi:MAG: glucose-1-phosphate adenylyltransferase [Anaerolineae bacterium]|nr:glucose-1-phosphate adenylyltransferase [Anaerolineae bacterium]